MFLIMPESFLSQQTSILAKMSTASIDKASANNCCDTLKSQNLHCDAKIQNLRASISKGSHSSTIRAVIESQLRARRELQLEQSEKYKKAAK